MRYYALCIMPEFIVRIWIPQFPAIHTIYCVYYAHCQFIVCTGNPLATQFIVHNSLGRQHIPRIPQFIVLYLLCQDLLWLLQILDSSQFTQFISFIVDIMIHSDVQGIHHFTQFIMRTSAGYQYILTNPQFIVQYLLCKNLLWLLQFLHSP